MDSQTQELAQVIDAKLRSLLPHSIYQHIKTSKCAIFGSFILHCIYQKVFPEINFPLTDIDIFELPEKWITRDEIRDMSVMPTSLTKKLSSFACCFGYKIGDGVTEAYTNVPYTFIFGGQLRGILRFHSKSIKVTGIDVCVMYDQMKTFDELFNFLLRNNDMTISCNMFYYVKGEPFLQIKFPSDVFNKQTRIGFKLDPIKTLKRCEKYLKRGIKITQYHAFPNQISLGIYRIRDDLKICKWTFKYVENDILINFMAHSLIETYQRNLDEKLKKAVLDSYVENFKKLPTELLHKIYSYRSPDDDYFNCPIRKCMICADYRVYSYGVYSYDCFNQNSNKRLLRIAGVKEKAEIYEDIIVSLKSKTDAFKK